MYEVVGPRYGVTSSPIALHVTLDSYFKSIGVVTVGCESAG